jgi:uncharacterized membrane protein YdfJ with MMPL/SSD domain
VTRLTHRRPAARDVWLAGQTTAAAGTPSIKEIGLGLSVAIALDATLIRLILVPATMEILGRWN